VVYDLWAMGLNSNIFKDFRGGLNTRDPATMLDDNESPDLLNVQVGARGELKRRKGSVLFQTGSNPIPIGKRIANVEPWYRTATTIVHHYPAPSTYAVSDLLVSAAGDIYRSDSVGTLTLLWDSGGPGADSIWDFQQMEDSVGDEYMWCLNGASTMKKIKASTLVVSDWGGTPPQCSMAKVWRNFMVIAGNNTFKQRLYFSALGNPESWTTATDFIDVKTSDDDEDPITWLELSGDDLLIFKKNTVWRLTAGPPNPVVKRVGQPGCFSRFQSCRAGNRVYYWSESGLWSLDERVDPALVPIRHDSIAINNRIQTDTDGAQYAQVRLHSDTDDRVFVAISGIGAFGENNILLEYVPWLIQPSRETAKAERQLGAWFWHDLKVSSICTLKISTATMTIAALSQSNQLLKLFEGDTDYVAGGTTAVIDSHWTSSKKSFSPEEYFERLRRLNVLMDGAISISTYLDFSNVAATTTILTTTGTQLKRARPEGRARYHSWKIQNVVGADFSIYSVEAVIRGRKEH
jgi:hypothetical protein